MAPAVLGVVTLMATAIGLVETRPPAPFDAWPDSTFAAMVVEPDTGRTLFSYDSHEQFRSASLVKLLIAVDLLEGFGPRVAGPADTTLVTSMLRSSDDDAASVLWVRDGYAAIVDRTVRRLGLTDTEAPVRSGSWGYTATSAADVARVYRHLLVEAPPAVRDVVLAHLRASTRCAVDGHDQSFGIPRSTALPRAAKQAWSGVGDPPAGATCTPSPRSALDPGAVDREADAAPRVATLTGSDPDVEASDPVLHTSGVVWSARPEIVVILSLHPAGTPFDEGARRLDGVTRALLARVGACGGPRV